MVAPVELISKKKIKPFSETPPSRRVFRLSSVDQLVYDVNVPIAFFYTSHGTKHLHRSEMSLLLQESLSKTMSYYFPFAGRTNEDFINCNDDGVLLLEVQIRCPMSEMVDYPHAEDLVFPQGLPWSTSGEGHLAAFQLSYFDCGGMAISACLSHRLADASTASTFINDWASMARQPDHKPCPYFVGTSVFPPLDNLSSIPIVFSKSTSCITKTFVFDALKIAQLKAIAADCGVENPTRVDVVTALLITRALSATKACRGTFKPSLLSQAVNLRQLMTPPLPENSIGNVISNFFIPVTEENKVEFSWMVSQIINEKIKHKNQFKEELEANDYSLDIHAIFRDRQKHYTDDSIHLYHCSSWCGFSFYKIDFGWGRPLKVCTASLPQKNRFILMDTPSEDGIEAMVTLEKQVMSIFECDSQLLGFASSISDP